MLGFILGVVIAAAATPIPQAQTAAACPREPVRAIEESNFILPPDPHATHDTVRFTLDIGADGRLRRSVLTESSGDPAIDAAAAQALTQFRFAAPTFGCVATSTTWSWFWRLPDEIVSRGTGRVERGSVAERVPRRPTRLPRRARRSYGRLGSPFPRTVRNPEPQSSTSSLDANARVTAVHLVQSSGETKTDYAAAVAARNGLYVFVRVPGCPSGATVYRLELTFR